MIIDIHAHTKPYSEDSELNPNELIEHAKRSGLDGICLTEHDCFWKDEEILKLSRAHDFPVFPGVEINTEDGHFIVFGLRRYEFGMHHTDFVRRLVDDVGGTMILAHPYRGRIHHNPAPEHLLEGACRNPVFNLIDAVEMLNGRSKDVENRFSGKLSRKLKLTTVGGSDAHALADIPACATFFERKVGNIKELITELKEGRCRATELRSTKTH